MKNAVSFFFFFLLCSILALLLTVLMIAGAALPVYAENEPEIKSEAAILIDASNGHVLFEKDADKVMFPASTTKIMTAVVALENADLEEVVTVSKNAQNQEGTLIYLRYGDKITIENLLYGLMLNSGNDAAVAIAEHIGGSVEAENLNERVQKIFTLAGLPKLITVVKEEQYD